MEIFIRKSSDNLRGAPYDLCVSSVLSNVHRKIRQDYFNVVVSIRLIYFLYHTGECNQFHRLFPFKWRWNFLHTLTFWIIHEFLYILHTYVIHFVLRAYWLHFPNFSRIFGCTYRIYEYEYYSMHSRKHSIHLKTTVKC